jgi:hypothetical protein
MYKYGAQVQDSGGANADSFGYSVALSNDGNTVIIGAPLDDVGANTDQGSVVVYFRNNGSWSQQAKLNGSSPVPPSRFGWSVAVSNDGNTMVVGAPKDSTGGFSGSGSAYIFSRTGSTWTEQVKLTNPTPVASGDFGISVAISGDGLRVAIARDYVPSLQTENVRIYFYNGSSWVFEQELTRLIDDDGRDVTLFGYSLAFNDNGSTLIVGAPGWDGGSGAGNDDTGAVIVYTRSGTTWSFQATLKDNTMQTNYELGDSVALSSDGNTAICGAASLYNGSSTTGSATIFTRSGTTWSKLTKLTDSTGVNGDRFGASVDLSKDGKVALIGAPRDDVGAVVDQGSAIIYTLTNGGWQQGTKLTNPSGVSQADDFGTSVALSRLGNVALIGTPYDDIGVANQGSATIFYRR